LRPASARDVATLLPGGDPLAAAIAAGETPSPEIVAASGPDAGLSANTAVGILGGTLAMLVVLVALSDRASTLGWVSWPRSPDALEDHARSILVRLGHDLKPVDRTRMIFAGAFSSYRQYIWAHDRSPDRWKTLREPGQLDTTFWYGQAQRYWVPLNWFAMVIPNDPAPAAGDVSMGTDLRGRLFWLLVRPLEAHVPAESSVAPDWSTLFEAAGLDPSAFQPAAPTRAPLVMADTRAAWTGTLADFSNYPVRIEAAALRGKPVFFEKVVPWDSYWDPTASESGVRRTSWLANALQALLLAFAFTVAGILVLRNWLDGRGDRRGALSCCRDRILCSHRNVDLLRPSRT
jgi:eukaryotic-like serine/threonine-protein kinase